MLKSKKLFLIALFLLSIADSLLYAQTKKIEGIVTDKYGPLTGVTVLVARTKKGTITDLNGKFTIQATANDDLIFSYIGYESKIINVNNSSILNIELKESSKSLDEVVVVGYGEQRRKDVTGSVSKASVSDMNKAPVGNFTDALSGRVAGVVVTSPDGQPGSAPNIVIRGNGSITQDNSPLWVVDGFPMENYDNNSINPADIESIDILKDASSTAIYGARGANGVILVTTKKGKVGAPAISFNSSVSVLTLDKKMDLMNPVQFLQLQSERDELSNNLYRNTTTGEVGPLTYTEATYFKYATINDYAKYALDLQSLMFRPSFTQNYDINISGGSDRTKYFVSGNYLDQNGLMINSGYKRAQGKVVLDQTINNYIKMGININYSNNIQNGASPLASNTPGYFTSQMSPFYMLWGYRPVSPINENGQLSIDILNDFIDPDLLDGNASSSYLVNPITNQMNQYNVSTTNGLTANGYLTIRFNTHLSLKSTFGYVSTILENDVYYNNLTAQGSPLTALGSINGNNGYILITKKQSWSNENILTYNATFRRKHNISLTGLISEQKGFSYSSGMSALQCPNPDLGISGLDEGTPGSITSTSSNWSLVSFMARANYNFDSRYYITLTNRMDGSSKFSTGNKWANFSSGALKWNFTNEKFMGSIKNILSNGALRLSLGQTGNNRVSDFATYATMSIGTDVAPYVFNNSIPSSAITNVAGNSSLKWETTTQSNLGLDIGFLKDKISATVDIYNKTTQNLLLYKNASPVSGYYGVMANMGSLENKGLEIGINTVNIKSKDFEWTTNFNISWNKNKILSLGQGQESLTSVTAFDQNFKSSPSYISKVGEPIGQMYGLVWDGVYQYSDFNYITSVNTSAYNVGAEGSHWILKDNVPTNGNARASIQPGDVKYKDLNGDGIIDSNDLTVIGRGTPIHTGGIGNNFTYKNFDLNLFFQWSYGNNIQNANRIIFEGNVNNSYLLNQFASYLDRWSPTNQDSKNYRSYGSGPTGYYSSRTIEDGSYLRLKTVSLGYSFSKDILNKVSVKSLRIYVSAQNLFTLTKYTGLDPEVSSYNSVLTPGFDWSAYPKGRVVSVGLNVQL